MSDCIFCKIINHEISAEIIYEDEYAMAFLDISPVNLGHSLVLPKTHFRNILDIPPDDLCKIIPAVQKVSKAIIEATEADGINFANNNEPAAGQLVFHLHFHLIPRFSNDGLIHWGKKDCKKDEVTQIAEKIRDAL